MSSILGRLLEEHRKLRCLGASLDELLASSTPCDPAVLTERRWALARMVVQHLTFEDRQVFQRLEQDSRPEAVAKGARFKQDIVGYFDVFQDHVGRWTAEAAVQRWPEYRIAGRRFVTGMCTKLNREEAELFPLLSDPGCFEARRRPGDRNWAGEGWALREKIAATEAKS